MNCRPGDLAVIVRATRIENLGKIVRCIRLHTDPLRDADGMRWRMAQAEPRWVIDPPIRNTEGVRMLTAPDSALRPIRDNDGTDETLIANEREVAR